METKVEMIVYESSLHSLILLVFEVPFPFLYGAQTSIVSHLCSWKEIQLILSVPSGLAGRGLTSTQSSWSCSSSVPRPDCAPPLLASILKGPFNRKLCLSHLPALVEAPLPGFFPFLTSASPQLSCFPALPCVFPVSQVFGTFLKRGSCMKDKSSATT